MYRGGDKVRHHGVEGREMRLEGNPRMVDPETRSSGVIQLYSAREKGRTIPV